MLFTFWEGPQPEYIALCLQTWKIPYTVLNYDNVSEYTDLPLDNIRRFSLPQIADIVRVHVLRDNGGYWLDADTIMLEDRLPSEATILGDPGTRVNTCGYLHTEAGSQMFNDWADYQDHIIEGPATSRYWATFGNSFTDPYLQEHKEIEIAPVWDCWPEVYMITDERLRMYKYPEFYFNSSYTLHDINHTPMLMLHNSWTPRWYKGMDAVQVLQYDCTLSNFLREALE